MIENEDLPQLSMLLKNAKPFLYNHKGADLEVISLLSQLPLFLLFFVKVYFIEIHLPFFIVSALEIRKALILQL